MKRTTLIFVGFLVIGIAIAVTGSLEAERPMMISASANSAPPASILPGDLPQISKADQQVRKDGDRATSQLFFDDGTCEAGLGAAATITALVEFDVPAVCTQAGLSIIGVTGRVNTGTATGFSLRQAGAVPGTPGSGTNVPLATSIAGAGSCAGTATTGQARAITPGVAVVAGTANFFAGMVGNAYFGRDTNSAPAGRIWINCATCGNTTYSPAALTGYGLGGNWIMRVTVEDANCVPVELQSFGIE
ncbi:MAG: hypothetical protein DRJ61_08420 [Acidobacteria bacterium]|nr:MAG: hypothetical protein DRJ65_07445 [Acidobacteriota bacterium]RLE32907.1 MAG: hypothetical protein DRJ61_08420 [Acidobacteriota bacterium]